MARLELEFTVGEVRKEKRVSKKLERSRKQEERSKKNKSERSGRVKLEIKIKKWRWKVGSVGGMEW